MGRAFSTSRLRIAECGLRISNFVAWGTEPAGSIAERSALLVIITYCISVDNVWAEIRAVWPTYGPGDGIDEDMPEVGGFLQWLADRSIQIRGGIKEANFTTAEPHLQHEVMLGLCSDDSIHLSISIR